MTVVNVFSFLRSQFEKSIFNTESSVYFEPLIEQYFPGKSLTGNKAKVLEIEREVADTLAITLQPNSKWNTFIPGQYIMLGIKINAVWHYRTFSIASSLQQLEQKKTIKLCIQRQENGKVTKWLFDHLKEGDFVTISDAKGDFNLPEDTKAALLIAGGTGITPFISILHDAAVKNQDVILLYYAKIGHHILKAELDDLKSYENIQIHYLSSKVHGRFCTDHLQTFCPDFKDRNVMICGPSGLIEFGSQLLKKECLEPVRLNVEYFKAANIRQLSADQNTPSFIQTKDQKIAAQSNLSILSQLEAAGLQPKYGCRMGICKQCQCLKTSGIVFNQVTGKFSEATEEPIQICISVPVGEVSIDL